MSILSVRPRGGQTRNIKRKLLTSGDDEAMNDDIVDKFIAVSGVVDNKTRELARENIRRKLALEAGKEKTDSSCDLQLCFVNDITSDDDSSEEIDAARTMEDITRGNISNKEGQIIVPIVPTVSSEEVQSETQLKDVTNPMSSLAVSQFQAEVSNLQQKAREGLVKAREKAKVSLQDRINTRRQANEKLFTLLGINQLSKLNRRTLSRLNVAQLQLIQNDYLAQIESLNDELMKALVMKDELSMEQDAMLTDIEDLSEFVNKK